MLYFLSECDIFGIELSRFWLRVFSGNFSGKLLLGVDWLLGFAGGSMISCGSKLSHSALSVGRKNEVSMSNCLTVSFEATDEVGVVKELLDSHFSVNSLIPPFEPGEGVVFDDFLGPNISSLGLSVVAVWVLACKIGSDFSIFFALFILLKGGGSVGSRFPSFFSKVDHLSSSTTVRRALSDISLTRFSISLMVSAKVSEPRLDEFEDD